MRRAFHLSIKLRVTLWYTLLFVLLALALLAALMAGVTRATEIYMEDILTEAVSAAAEEVRYAQGIPLLQTEGLLDFDRVSFALLDTNSALWQGRWPPFEAAYLDGAVRRAADAQGHVYYVQDLLLPFDEGDLWLRGYVSMDSMRFVRDEVMGRTGMLFPLAILAAALGGYLLTRRAFRPVARMARTAEGIAEGRDLSRRFETGAGRPDEIGALAHTFNGMFARLEESFERERQFADDASHELRTPIAVIRSACDYALACGGEAELREALRLIDEKAAGMGALVAQLLSMARMDAGRIEIERESVDLSALCLSVAEELAPRAAARGVSLDTAAVAPGILVTGDELLLLRLTLNLTDNAVKFARSRVTLSLERGARGVRLVVEDDGVGMDEAARARAFDRFFQADRARSGGGAGLGLSMARQIARLHGGEALIERTAPGEGARLAVELP